MRFQVEKTFLKPATDRFVLGPEHAMTFLQTEAEDVGEALSRILSRQDTELVDEVHWLPGSQAVTAVREGGNVFMLQFSPISEDSELDPDDTQRNRS